MAKNPQRETITGINDLLTQIGEFDPTTLGQQESLGEINFSKCKDDFVAAVKLAKELGSYHLESLPRTINFEHLLNRTKALSDAMTKISDFRLSDSDNPKNTRDSLAAEVTSAYDVMYKDFLPYMPFLAIRGMQVHDVVETANELLADTKSELEDFRINATSQKTRVEEIVKATQDAAAKIGVAKFAPRFAETAKQHADDAGTWLKITFGLGGLTLVIAIVLAYISPAQIYENVPTDAQGNPSYSFLLAFLVGKLVIVSLGYVMTTWASRNYRAHKHLATVNGHRSDALKTFEVFVEAAGDNVTRDAVLLEATRCIFGPGVTGYLPKQDDPSPHRIVEVLKSLDHDR